VSAFSPDQVRRYSRHVLIPDVGGIGQTRLLASAVAIDLGGAARRIAAAYLVAAGVGQIWLNHGGPVTVATARFPLGADDVGQAVELAMRDALATRNRDVVIAIGPAPARAHHLVVEHDSDELSLAEAFTQGGAAAAILVHYIATGGPA
jgi:adenylyltransferase/sulfurtransferase